MGQYTKHKIWRIRDLNDKFFEVVFQRESLNFLPGTICRVKSLEYPQPIFLSSGISEAWVRIILRRDLCIDFDFTQTTIKLDKEITNIIPDLANEESPNFLVTSEGVGAFYSYASTFPERKCEVCYIGDRQITPEWIRQFHKLVSIKDIKKAANLYVIGDNEIIHSNPMGVDILNAAKKVCLL